MLEKLLIKNFASLTEFTMTQVRAHCETEMEEAYPNNHTMSRSIARNLQGLRDDDVIIFVEGKRGTYRWGKRAIAAKIKARKAAEKDVAQREAIELQNEMLKKKECEETSGISKEMMWKMCQEQYKMIETLKEANASLTKEVDELKKKDRERLLMVAKARKVAQELLVSSSDEDDEKPLEPTWSNEAVIDSPPPLRRQEKKVEFDETVEEKVYEIDGTMRPHKSWKKEPVVKMSPNMGHW